MAPERDPRIAKAFSAMRHLGIPAETVKPVLKRLIKLYDRNFALIEEDNYRTLADAIFEEADDKAEKEEEKKIVHEVEPPHKKLNRGLAEDQVSSTGGYSRTIIDLEEEGEIPRHSTGTRIQESSHSFSQDKRKEPIQENSAPGEENSFSQAKSIVIYANVQQNDTGVEQENSNAIVLQGRQPIGSSTQFASPKIRPATNTSRNSDMEKRKDASSSAYDHQTKFQTTYDIASSNCGQVKLSLTCTHAAEQSNFRIPSAEEVLSFAERKYKASCRNVEAQSSVVNLLNELCESYLEMKAGSQDKSPANKNHTRRSLRSIIESSRTAYPEENLRKKVSSNDSGPSRGLIANDKRRVIHKVHDISNGTEKVKISLLDEVGYEDLPNFIYCPENITYESAYVHVSLARIADDDCCSGCIEDCLSSSIPCACARDTGGEFAYTPEGLLDEKFLRSCISEKQSPEKHTLFKCEDCPLERAKNAHMPEECKGHMLRKFIKECWRKCGCNMRCGNRVVQRGITRKLQVFLTGEGKGWGLRTLEELPRGAFVCEYVGEILTNIELYERNKKSKGDDKHVYPVLLDADWATEGVLKDEDALCLDATHYGNVARFINHRCFDGNLLEVPVQVETPDRHYYHLAFFTNRKVEALEELTWDYGIDFEDSTHPIKAFQCSCGSQFCRDRKRKS